jgi:citrate synthase
MEKQEYVELKIQGLETIRLRAIQGTEGGLAIDVSDLYKKWGILTYDPGYMSTGSCYSAISVYRREPGHSTLPGIQYLRLAVRNVDFVETRGSHPRQPADAGGTALLPGAVERSGDPHEGMLKLSSIRYRQYGDPMPIPVRAVQCSSLYHPEWGHRPSGYGSLMLAAGKLISKVRTIAAFSYRNPSVCPSSIRPGPRLLQ